MVIAYFALAGASVLLWIPILLRFYRSWAGRHNPISLAICALILLLVWFAVAGAWLITENISAYTMMVVSTSLSAAVALYAHFAFYWAGKRFSKSRDEE